MEADFDRYERDYEQLVERSIGWSGVEHSFFVEVKAQAFLDLLQRHVGDPGTEHVVDVGCGLGLMHRFLAGVGRLDAVDVSAQMVERARRTNPHVRYAVADAAALPYEDGAFDAACALGLLHHVVPAARDAVVRELGRVVRPGGLVAIFEHNPFNPLTRLAVARCTFDEDAKLLRRSETVALCARAGLRVVESRYIVFLPWRGRALRACESALRRVPLGAQYYVAAAAE